MNADDTDRDPTTTPGDGGPDEAQLSPVERAVGAYLDFLEGSGVRPDFDELADDDRADAVAVINTVLAGRGADLEASTPAFEELLVGTEFEAALRDAQAATVSASSRRARTDTGGARAAVDRQRARMERIATVLADADERVLVRTEPDEVVGSAVTVCYLDLRALFFAVDTDEPVITEDLRGDIVTLLANPELAYVGVIADGSAQLLTQLLSPADLGAVVVAPCDELTVPWLPVLNAPAAVRLMLDTAAPAWEPYRLDAAARGPLDIAAVAARVAQQVLAAETARAYRGDKKAAYQALTGSADAFTRLVHDLSRAPGVDDDRVAAALDAIVREAA